MYKWIFISIMVIQETKNFPLAFFLFFHWKYVCEWNVIQLNSSFQQRIFVKLLSVIVTMRHSFICSFVCSFKMRKLFVLYTHNNLFNTSFGSAFVGIGIVVVVVLCHVLCNVLRRVACYKIQSYIRSYTLSHTRTQNNLINYLLSSWNKNFSRQCFQVYLYGLCQWGKKLRLNERKVFHVPFGYGVRFSTELHSYRSSI